MKSKTKKTLVAWTVGTLFVGVLMGLVTLGQQVGITAFPMLIQVLGWVISVVLSRVS